MKIVVDANVVIAALIKPSITRAALLYPYIDYYSPDHLLEEIKEHEGDIVEKAGKGYKNAISIITRNIIIMPGYFYEINMREAHRIIGNLDVDDEQYIALALSLKADGIWSYDERHFGKQNEVSLFSTGDLLSLIKKGIV